MKLTRITAFCASILLSTAIQAAPVNINSASAKDIAAALTGIGISKAMAIVKYRKQNGKFKSAADIVQVKGIGQSTYSNNKKDILIK